MLDVLGAGATATSDQDWHEIWKGSKESLGLQDEIERIHSEGRKRPPIAAAVHGTFATSWAHQAGQLIQRNFISYWRTPAYLMAKLALNIVGGLFIGFTFFKSNDTIQGTQNKLFVSFSSVIYLTKSERVVCRPSS
jgi:ATP-binding cassette subfamily G (WHITE) protein 2 (SNQ2)